MRNKLQILLAILLMAVLLVSCAGTQEDLPVGDESAPVMEEAAPTTDEEVPEEEAAGEETALLVGEMAYTMSQLEGLETIEAEYTGKDDTVTVYTGVPVNELLAEAGLEGETAIFIAGDGYQAELAMADLESCPDCLVAFDDGELRMVLPGFPGNVQVKGVVELQVK